MPLLQNLFAQISKKDTTDKSIDKFSLDKTQLMKELESKFSIVSLIDGPFEVHDAVGHLFRVNQLRPGSKGLNLYSCLAGPIKDSINNIFFLEDIGRIDIYTDNSKYIFKVIK